MSQENVETRQSSTPEEDRMVVSASSEARPPTGGPATSFSPGQPSSSTNTETADVIVEEDSTRAVSRVKGLLSCTACRVLLQYGEHTPKLLPSCLHTVCSRCAEQRNSGKRPFRVFISTGHINRSCNDCLDLTLHLFPYFFVFFCILFVAA